MVCILNITIVLEPIPSPTSLTSVSTAMSIFLQWEQERKDLIEMYEITYNYTVRRCSSQSVKVNYSIISDGMTNYNLSNCHETPVEEDSEYHIVLTALNSVGRSESISTQLSTLQSGTHQ